MRMSGEFSIEGFKTIGFILTCTYNATMYIQNGTVSGIESVDLQARNSTLCPTDAPRQSYACKRVPTSTLSPVISLSGGMRVPDGDELMLWGTSREKPSAMPAMLRNALSANVDPVLNGQ